LPLFHSVFGNMRPIFSISLKPWAKHAGAFRACSIILAQRSNCNFGPHFYFRHHATMTGHGRRAGRRRRPPSAIAQVCCAKPRLASAQESGMRMINPTIETTITITTTFGSSKLWLATTSAAAALR
jgi:hypothetical protein